LDWVSAVFLLLIICTGGVIAWLADRLGRALGKKRFTLHKMRPRHTAALFTVLAGVLVSLLSIVVLLAVNAPLRTVLVEGRRLISERDTAQADVKDLTAKRNELQGETSHLRDVNSSVRAEVSNVNKMLQARQQDIHDLEAKRAALQAKVGQLTAEIGTANRKLRDADTRLASAKTDLKSAQKKYGQVQASYAELFSQQKQLQARNVELDNQNQKLSDELSKLNGELAALQQDKENLTATIQQDQQTVDQSEQAAEKAKLDLAGAQQELADVRNTIAAMKAMIQQDFQKSRTQPLIYAKDQEIVRLPLDPGLTPTLARDYATTLMREARLEAQSAGAGGDPCALLPPITTSDGQVLAEDDQLDLMAKEIANKRENLVLVAYAAVNSFKGEPVGVYVRTFRNPTVYKQGQVVADTRINGADSLEKVVAELQQFIANDVRKAAEDHKMIPRQGEQEGLGQVSMDQILNLAEEIRLDGRELRVQAVARGATRAADLLQLDFRFR